tara:strand:- start:101 stop:301 length:201 start_codon:yes stop_codon:yes gene_type:complete
MVHPDKLNLVMVLVAAVAVAVPLAVVVETMVQTISKVELAVMVQVHNGFRTLQHLTGNGRMMVMDI